MTVRRVRLQIKGLVQGVSYRMSARDAAQSLAVTGWVRNLPNGHVEAIAEAPHESLEQFIAWCRRGPDEARVEAVEVEDLSIAEPLNDFQVRR